jgi:phenylacetate-CoA ligase
MWDVKGVKQFRFIQEDAATYTLWLNGDKEEMDVENILERIRPYLGEKAQLTVEYVDEIPVLASGKRKYIENRWKAGEKR